MREMRRLGIDIMSQAPWGTHFCQFYQTREDLIDIMVPYIKAGLDNNEFCLWVTSGPLNNTDAEMLLGEAVRNLDDYIKKGQIEIFDFKQWYLKAGRFSSDEVLRVWVKKESEALRSGFDGLRFAGDASWIEKGDWKTLVNHEAVVSEVINQHHILAVCSYCLERYGPSEIIDVAYNHQFAVIRIEGEWKAIESSVYMKLAKEIKRWTAMLERFNEMSIRKESEIIELRKKIAEMEKGLKNK